MSLLSLELYYNYTAYYANYINVATQSWSQELFYSTIWQSSVGGRHNVISTYALCQSNILVIFGYKRTKNVMNLARKKFISMWMYFLPSLIMYSAVSRTYSTHLITKENTHERGLSPFPCCHLHSERAGHLTKSNILLGRFCCPFIARETRLLIIHQITSETQNISDRTFPQSSVS